MRRRNLNDLHDPPPKAPLTTSMLISEAVYKLIVCVELLIRWINRRLVPPCRLLYWCLRW